MRIKRFDGSDFLWWKAKVVNKFRFLGLRNWVEVKPEAGKTPDQEGPAEKALAFVMEALSDNLFSKYQDVTPLKDLWDKK